MSAHIEIRPVRNRREEKLFVAVPWTIGRGDDPRWIPPLRRMVHDALDPERDPFWAQADRELFVAFRGGRPVGRIAAIENRRHNEVHADRVGFFGFFDTIDDPTVVRALFDAAEGWLASRGLERARGPVSPSMNHEPGLLVDGFDRHPTFLTPWNPPWQPALIEGAGYARAADLVGYPFPIADGYEIPERLRRLTARVRRRLDVRLRPMDLSKVDSESEVIRPLFNDAWSGNWGFVPMRPEEFRFVARELKPLLRPRYAVLAEVDGRPVGFFLVAFDLNEVLRRIPSGRLGPVALLRLLLGVPRIGWGRIFLLGVDRAYRSSGLLAILLEELVLRAREDGLTGGEASWILEDNRPMCSALEAMGVAPYRRWRIYEKTLAPGVP